MSDDSAEKQELTALTQAYQQAIADVMALDISDVARIARLLEVEARFQGMFEACRENRGAGGRGKARLN